MRVTIPFTAVAGFLFALMLGACPDRRVAAPPSSATAATSIPPDIPAAGLHGYTNPTCSYCPIPQYSSGAFRQKIQGEVVLDVVIGADGRAHEIAVKKGLERGLDEQAIHAVRDVWLFKPANGPDGKPATVHMLIEIDFHLY